MSRKSIPLSGIATYLNGYPFKPSDHKSSGIPVIRIRQFLDPGASGDFYDKPLPERYQLRTGDVIFSWSATLACGEWNRGPAYLNQHLFKVVPTEGYDKRFVMYAIQAALPYFETLAHGSTMTHIRISDLSKATVPEFSLREQHRIVDLLSSADHYIATQSAATNSLINVRNALLQELLSRDEGASETCLLSDKTALGSGTTPSTAVEEFWGGSQPWLSPAEVSHCRGEHVTTSKKALTKSGSARATIYPPGTVFYTSRATIGGICINDVPMACSQGFVAMKPGPEINSDYLALVMEKLTPLIKTQSSGSTFPEIRASRLGALSVNIPPLDQQIKVVGTMAAVKNRVAANEMQLSTLRGLRAQLLGDLLSGAHEIPEAYDLFLEGISS